MNERTLRPANVAAAAVLIGGVLIVVLPQHGLSIVQLVVVTIAAAAALYALAISVPEWSATWWRVAPFNRPSRAVGPTRRLRATHPARPARLAPRNGGVRRPFGRGRSRGPGNLERIRSKLSGRRQPISNGPPVPPEALRLLQPLIRVALEREGLDPGDEAHRETARALLSPLTWAVLTSEPLRGPPWYRTRRRAERQVADVVHRVFDDLDRLAAGGGDSQPIPRAPHPRAI